MDYSLVHVLEGTSDLEWQELHHTEYLIDNLALPKMRWKPYWGLTVHRKLRASWRRRTSRHSYCVHVQASCSQRRRMVVTEKVCYIYKA
jgi:hypothetical protein